MKRFLFFLSLFISSQLLARTEAERPVVQLLPKPDFAEGWQWDMEPEIYLPKNLYEYIDGEAELYNDYSFVEMATVLYAQKDNASISLTMDIYDMGAPLNAFGVYSSYRRPDQQFEKIGDEAIISELNIRFYKGDYFIQINAGSMDASLSPLMKKLAVELASKIPAADTPAELGLLPEQDRVNHSLTYTRAGFLGQSVFTSTMHALYKLADVQCTGFVSIFPDADKAKEALNQFSVSTGERGEIYSSPVQSDILIAETEYQGKIMAAVQDRYIIGVTGYKSQTVADGLFERIRATVKCEM